MATIVSHVEVPTRLQTGEVCPIWIVRFSEVVSIGGADRAANEVQLERLTSSEFREFQRAHEGGLHCTIPYVVPLNPSTLISGDVNDVHVIRDPASARTYGPSFAYSSRKDGNVLRTERFVYKPRKVTNRSDLAAFALACDQVRRGLVSLSGDPRFEGLPKRGLVADYCEDMAIRARKILSDTADHH